MSRAQEIMAERSKPGWRPTETELGYLQTHDMPTIPASELPLDAIADFCREWGIKELYSVPLNLEFFEPGGPFDGTELSVRFEFREDAEIGMEYWGLGRMLGEAIGIKTYGKEVPKPHFFGFGWREELILERMVPLYAE